MEILIIGVGALLVYLLAKSKGDKAAQPESPPPLEEEPPPPSEPEDGKVITPPEPSDDLKGSLIKKGQDLIGGLIPPDPDDPVIVTPAPGPDLEGPGSTPSDPIGSKSIYEGFVGYFVVESGDNMTKMANRLGLGTGGWKALRDDPENQWAVDLCPAATKTNQYGGQDGIDLRQNYGKNPPLDCVAPGYKAKLYFKVPLTNQYPVLHWGG